MKNKLPGLPVTGVSESDAVPQREMSLSPGSFSRGNDEGPALSLSALSTERASGKADAARCPIEQNNAESERAQPETGDAKPQVRLRLDLVKAADEAGAPCSGSSNGNTSSSGSSGLQHQPLSAVTELHLGLLGATAKAPHAPQPPGMSQPTLRVVRLPKPSARGQQQAYAAFEGHTAEDGRVFCLTSAPNAEAADSFVPCFLASYFPEQKGEAPPCEEPKRKQQGCLQQGAPEKAGTVDAIKASTLARLDWSEAYSAVSPSDGERGPRNRNHVVRELLLTEQKELLQLEGLMQKDDLRKELDVLQQVIQGWERVEALDKQLEAKEKRVEELEAAIAASRNLLRDRWAEGDTAAGLPESAETAPSAKPPQAAEVPITQGQRQQLCSSHCAAPHASPSGPSGSEGPVASSIGPGVRRFSEQPPAPDVDTVLAGKVLCGGSPMQLLQRVRRLRGAADSRNLSRVPLNIRRRLQKAAAAAAIAAAVHARHDPDGGDLQGPVEKPSKAGDEALNGEHQPAAGDAPDGTPESAAAARAASAAPEAKGAAADPGPWRVVVKRRRQWGSEIRRAVRSLAAASYDTQQHDAPLAESPSAATGNAAAAEAEAAAEAQQRCSDACIALEAYAATVGRNAARDAPTAFIHSDVALEELRRIDKRLEELASQLPTKTQQPSEAPITAEAALSDQRRLLEVAAETSGVSEEVVTTELRHEQAAKAKAPLYSPPKGTLDSPAEASTGSALSFSSAKPADVPNGSRGSKRRFSSNPLSARRNPLRQPMKRWRSLSSRGLKGPCCLPGNSLTTISSHTNPHFPQEEECETQEQKHRQRRQLAQHLATIAKPRRQTPGLSLGAPKGAPRMGGPLTALRKSAKGPLLPLACAIRGRALSATRQPPKGILPALADLSNPQPQHQWPLPSRPLVRPLPRQGLKALGTSTKTARSSLSRSAMLSKAEDKERMERKEKEGRGGLKSADMQQNSEMLSRSFPLLGVDVPVSGGWTTADTPQAQTR